MKELPPIGARVVRNRPYKEPDRVLTGTVVRHWGLQGSMTHAVVDYDDGMTGNVHPSALDLVAPPRPVPRFASVEEADRWLEEQEADRAREFEQAASRNYAGITTALAVPRMSYCPHIWVKSWRGEVSCGECGALKQP